MKQTDLCSWDPRIARRLAEEHPSAILERAFAMRLKQSSAGAPAAATHCSHPPDSR